MIDNIAQEGKARGEQNGRKQKKGTLDPCQKKLQILMIQREFGLQNFLQKLFSMYT